MTSTTRLRARQRDLLHRHSRAFSQFGEQAIAEFDRMVLEVLADSVTAEAAIIPEFQRVANEAMTRAMCADKLPSRPTNGRPADRIFDDPKRAASVRSYLKEVRQKSMRMRLQETSRATVQKSQEPSNAEIAEKIAERAGTSSRNLMRWVSAAMKEGRIPAADTASVSPETIADELGIAHGHLHPPGIPWTLTVDDHGPANQLSIAMGDDIPLRPWPPDE